MPRQLLSAICRSILILSIARITVADEAIAGMGIMVGEVTSNSALIQVRLTNSDRLIDGDVTGVPGSVEFTIEPLETAGLKPGFPASQKYNVAASADRDFISRARAIGLAPGIRYACTTRISSSGTKSRPGPQAEFKTLPGAKRAAEFNFVVVTGMNYAKFHGDERIDRKQHLIENNTELPKPYTGPDKHLGYPALASILKLEPDFLVGTGDNVYYDTPDDPRAETIPQLRQKWHEQFVQRRYVDLFARVPTYWQVDDHDYRYDDGDNSGDYEPSPEIGRKILLEQLPYAPQHAKNPKTYRTHRVSRDLQIWLTENRMLRSPNAMPDGPEKTIWGAEQKRWLKETLAASDATFKLLISPTPMVGPDDLRKTDNHTNIGGFRHERDEIFAWLKESGVAGQGFYILCGDRHWQYHAIDPSGIEEFSCGALVDANSRLGRKPGDPKGTDPEGLIKHVYYQDPRSGGFLQIESNPAHQSDPAKLSFIFHDERGNVLYRDEKSADAARN